MGVNKYTPGSWAITTRRGSWDWVVFQERNPNIEICQLFHDGTEENERGEANARLVAAAPDMLALLKLALGDTEYVLSQGFWDEVRAVIAKATGETLTPNQ